MKLFRAKYPSILRMLYPERISVLPNSSSIYLTFDDGPIPEITPWVLEQLKKYNAKATFFCIGENIKKHPDIFQQILADGHTVGNHTFQHLNGWKTPTPEYLENTIQTEKILAEYNFENEKLFRPPYGKIKNKQAKAIKKLGYTIVMWDVISGDYDEEFSEEQCYKNVIENAGNGSTIVFHDSKKAFKNLQQVLPKVLEYYSEKGLKFSRIKAVPLAGQ